MKPTRSVQHEKSTESENRTPVNTPPFIRDTTANLWQRWNAALAEIESVEKLGDNKDQDYKFMRGADVFKTIRPLIAKHGMVLKVNPDLALIADSEYKTARGTTMHCVRLVATCELINIDTPTEREVLLGIADSADSSDKCLNKARTIALKYIIRDNFLIDDQKEGEADAETHERASGSESKPVTKEFNGIVIEAQGASSDTRKWMWFTLQNNNNEKFFTFVEDDWLALKEMNRVAGTVVQKWDSKQRPYWEVSKIAVLNAQDKKIGDAPTQESMFEKSESKPAVTVFDVLKRIFPTAADIKRRRIVEEDLKGWKVGEDVKLKAAESFEKRIASEKPKSEAGTMSLLDISKQEAVEESIEEAARKLN